MTPQEIEELVGLLKEQMSWVQDARHHLDLWDVWFGLREEGAWNVMYMQGGDPWFTLQGFPKYAEHKFDTFDEMIAHVREYQRDTK